MICVGLLAGCGAGGTPNNTQTNPGTTVSPAPTGTDQQGVYVASVLRDRNSLFAGFVVTPKNLRFRLAETTSLDVVVCGVDSPRPTCADNLAAALAQQTAAPSSTPTVGATPSSTPTPTRTTGTPTSTTRPPSGTPSTTSSSNTNTIQIGGQVAVSVTGDPSLTIRSNSQSTQPVLLKTESASWSFNVVPSAVGSFNLVAHISVLQGANGPPLLPEQTVNIPLDVYQTSTDRIASDASSFWKLVQEIAAVLGATGISVTAVAVYLVRRVRRRRRERAAGGPVPPGFPPSPYPQAAAPPPAHPAQRTADYPPRPATPPASPPPGYPPASPAAPTYPPAYPPPPAPTPPPAPAPRPAGPPGGYPQQPNPYPPIPAPPPQPPEPPTRTLGP